MSDSQEQNDSAGNDPAGVSGASDSSSDAGDDSPTEMEVLQTSLTELRTQIGGLATKAEVAPMVRSHGHVPGLQSALDGLKEQVDGLPSGGPSTADITELREMLGTLASAVSPLLTDEQAGPLRSLRDAAQVRSGIAEAVDPLRADIASLKENLQQANAADDAEGDPATSVADLLAWRDVSVAITSYMKGKGVDPATIPASVWSEAQTAHPGDPKAAEAAVIAVIDAKAVEAAAPARREERKTAGAAGGSPPAAAGGDGKLTLDAMQKMTSAELQAVPREERDRVLATI